MKMQEKNRDSERKKLNLEEEERRAIEMKTESVKIEKEVEKLLCRFRF